MAYIIFFTPCKMFAQQIDSFSLSGYITFPSPEKVVEDSLKWEPQPIIKKSLDNRKIKQILLQHISNKARFFFKNGEVMEMSKDEAVMEGFLRAPIDSLPKAYNDVVVMSPYLTFYVGNIYRIRIQDDNPGKFTLYDAMGHVSKNSQKEGEYYLKAFYPGKYQLAVNNINSRKTIYVYNCEIKPLPTDKAEFGPTLSIGDIDSLNVEVALFKNQKEIKISEGYTFQSARMSFEKEEDSTILRTSLTSTNLEDINWIPEGYGGGTKVSIDDIVLKDSTGKMFLIKGRFYILTDSNMNMSYINKSSEELRKLIKLNFVSGAIYFSGDGFENTKIVRLNPSGLNKYQSYYERCKPGSIITFDNVIYKNDKGLLSKPFSKTIKLE